MSRCSIIGVLILSAPVIITGCATGVMGGKPQLPLSDRNGTTRIFAAPESQVISAITNAFANFSYRGMVLREDEDLVNQQVGSTKRHFLLWAKHEPVAKVPLDKAWTKWVPYIADFRITVAASSHDLTCVVVQTVLAEVIDGKETFNLHGGTANHYRKVPAVREEEKNILVAIGVELPRAKD